MPVEKLLRMAKERKMMSFDIEHHPDHSIHDAGFEPTGCSFCVDRHVIYVKDKATVRRITDEIFPNSGIECIAFNGKYDIQGLVGSGWAEDYPETIVDPMIALNLLDDNLRPNELGLKTTISNLFRHQMMTFEQAYGFGLESPEFTKYACADAYWEFRLWERLKGDLKEQGLLKYFHSIPAVKVFADMERVGMQWDYVAAKRLLRGYSVKREELETAIFKEIGPLNLNSGDQIARRLFDELNYPTTGLKMTTSKKRVSTGVKEMEHLATRFPVCKQILLYRTAAKMISTYLAPLTERAMDSSDGRIHPTFWLVSSTGRTRCEKPNLQNQPSFIDEFFKGLEIKKGFTAAPGRVLYVSDLSQIELRLVAHHSKDIELLNAYRQWICTKCNSKSNALTILHKCPKCGVAENENILKDPTIEGFWHGLDLHQQTADKVSALHRNRQAAKTANFALVYCASSYQMNMTYPDFTVADWDEVIWDYFKVYQGVRQWHTHMENVLKTTGQTKDIFGRLRRIPSVVIRNSYKHALNQIVNFGPQSGACGMMQLALTKMREEFKAKGVWLKGIWPVNMVHDEILFEVEEDLVEVVRPIVTTWLENVVSLDVPVRTDTVVTDNWHSAK